MKFFRLNLSSIALIILIIITGLGYSLSFFIRTYSVPTSAMESTLPVGSYVLVYTFSKKISRNDLVAFRYPNQQGEIRNKTPFLKRCEGMPGDSIEIRDCKVFVNGKSQKKPKGIQYRYKIKTKQALNQRFIQQKKLDQYFNPEDIFTLAEDQTYAVFIQPKIAEDLRKMDFVEKVKLISTDEPDDAIFPQSTLFRWNVDNFGPLWIPQAGKSISINAHTIALYRTVIENYEGNKKVNWSQNQLQIEGKSIKNYTFKQNYYFMMGDNYHNSMDSRYTGFVPEDHLIGKIIFIWK